MGCLPLVSCVILCLVFMAISQTVDLEVFLGPETVRQCSNPRSFQSRTHNSFGQPADFHGKDPEGCRPKGLPIEWSY